MSPPPKNIWVAAGDGDLPRVQVRVSPLPHPAYSPHRSSNRNSYSPTARLFSCSEYARRFDNQNLHLALSPNTPDPNTYTPMHAAASYGHIHILQYLIAHGGDVNVTDEDGDTPLYTVENIETARFLVQHGAVVARQNAEGVSPIDHLTEDFPQIAAYLRSTLDGATPSASANALPPSAPAVALPPSQHSQNAATEHLTSALMLSVQDIMQRAEAEGRDPDEELRQAVSRTVLQGVVTGFDMSNDNDPRRGDPQDDTPAKRPRMDEDSG